MQSDKPELSVILGCPWVLVVREHVRGRLEDLRRWYTEVVGGRRLK